METNPDRNNFGKVLVFIVLIIIIISFSLQQLNAPFKEDLELNDIAGALGAMFIIILLVERVIEIFISIWRAPGSDLLKQQVETLEKAPTTPDQLIKAQEDYTKFKARTKSIALQLGFSISVLICATGIGLLSEIIDVLPEEAPSLQKSFIRGIDIVLTSGLIAGGSDAFHQFVNSIVVFFKTSKEKMENS
ncbi:MAG: hypothetical protein DWQ02_26720 [Bacteroidetes bacterium]|nr:MAG: hypothetical protein DWQ02_26720 [Bacteroidota bacterium]